MAGNHGGSRVGAGRKPDGAKPKRDRRRTVLDGTERFGDRSGPPPAPATPEEQAALAKPPADLTRAQKAFWRRYAPHAIEQGTLIPSRVLGFRELSEQFALKAALAAEIERVGAPHADSALRSYVKLAGRLDSSMARFKLTSFGKSEVAARRPQTSTAGGSWAQIGTK